MCSGRLPLERALHLVVRVSQVLYEMRDALCTTPKLWTQVQQQLAADESISCRVLDIPYPVHTPFLEPLKARFIASVMGRSGQGPILKERHPRRARR